MGAMTARITVTTPRRGTSKKTTTRKLTRQAISQVTRAIHKIIDNKPGQENFLSAQIKLGVADCATPERAKVQPVSVRTG
jgi:hypothetical protein